MKMNKESIQNTNDKGKVEVMGGGGGGGGIKSGRQHTPKLNVNSMKNFHIMPLYS